MVDRIGEVVIWDEEVRSGSWELDEIEERRGRKDFEIYI